MALRVTVFVFNGRGFARLIVNGLGVSEVIINGLGISRVVVTGLDLPKICHLGSIGDSKRESGTMTYLLQGEDKLRHNADEKSQIKGSGLKALINDIYNSFFSFFAF
jgi:hypothetical protein